MEECVGAYISAQRTPGLGNLVTDKGVKIIQIKNNDNKVENYGSVGHGDSNSEVVEGGAIASNQSKLNGQKENETSSLLG